MMKLDKIFVCLLVGLFETTAAVGKDVSSVWYNWGKGGLSLCGEPALSNDMCMYGNCDYYRANCTNGHSVYMMVARKIDGDCAYFCPTAVNACRTVKNQYANAYTTYSALGGDRDCVWLCKSGNYHDESKECDSSPVKALKDYGLLLVDGDNIENDIPMFSSQGNGCKANGSQEHDMILAVVEQVEHGAKVKQMVVRAFRGGDDSDYSAYPKVYPAGGVEELLLCKDGYKPGAEGTDCVEIDKDACQSETGSGDGAGALVTNEHNCTLGKQIWDTQEEECVAARGLSKMQMRQGGDISKNKSCWMMEDINEYKECIGLTTADTGS